MADNIARAVSGVRQGLLEVYPSEWVNTWRVPPHKGWRGFLIYKLRLPKKWFKPTEKTRLIYLVHNKYIVCSYENAAHILELVVP